jgi:hypothetical protein
LRRTVDLESATCPAINAMNCAMNIVLFQQKKYLFFIACEFK